MIRRATRDDLPAVQRVLSRAFADDPPMRFMFLPGGIEVVFRLAVERLTFPFGEVWVDSELRAAALWTPPGKWRLGWREHLRDLPSWAKAIGWTRLPTVAAATSELVGCHLAEPHYYLFAVGVDPGHRGRGLAAELLAPVLKQCDAEGKPAYLEASQPALVPFYRRLGFAPVREVRLGRDGPVMVPMVRAPVPPR